MNKEKEPTHTENMLDIRAHNTNRERVQEIKSSRESSRVQERVQQFKRVQERAAAAAAAVEGISATGALAVPTIGEASKARKDNASSHVRVVHWPEATHQVHKAGVIVDHRVERSVFDRHSGCGKEIAWCGEV
jgi:hypothetical protein